MKRTMELTKRSNKLIIINQSLYGIFRKITLFQKSAQVSLVNQFLPNEYHYGYGFEKQ